MEDDNNPFADFSRTIAMKAFPQLKGVFSAIDTMSDYMSSKDTLKEMPTKDQDNSDDSSKRRRSSLDITPITDGLDLLHTEIKLTNIILNETREIQIEANKLLLRIAEGSGEGTGGSGSENKKEGNVNTVEQAGEDYILFQGAKKLLGRLLPGLGSLLVDGAAVGAIGATAYGLNRLGNAYDQRPGADHSYPGSIMGATTEYDTKPNVEDKRTSNNFKKYGYIGGSIENLKEIFGFGEKDKDYDDIKKSTKDSNDLKQQLYVLQSKIDFVNKNLNFEHDPVKREMYEKERDELLKKQVALQEESTKLLGKIAVDTEKYTKSDDPVKNTQSNIGPISPDVEKYFKDQGINATPLSPDGSNELTQKDTDRRNGYGNGNGSGSPHIPGSASSYNNSSDDSNFSPVAVGDYKSLPFINKKTGQGSKDYEAYAMNYFKSKGYTAEQASVIMGNIQQESGFDPNSINKNDAGPGKDSVGIGQWNRQRLDRMHQFSTQMFQKPYDELTTQEKYQAQLGYLDHELHTPAYSNALNALKKGNYAEYGHDYEGYGDNSTQTRLNYAERIRQRESSGFYEGKSGKITGEIGESSNKEDNKFGRPDYGFGDSTVAGLRLPGDAVVGRHMFDNKNEKGTLTATKEFLEKNPDLKGKKVVVSGISNDLSQAAFDGLKTQIEMLKNAGADVDLIGGGSRDDIAAWNPKLEKLANDEGISFTPMVKTGADGVHPRNYAEQLKNIENSTDVQVAKMNNQGSSLAQKVAAAYDDSSIKAQKTEQTKSMQFNNSTVNHSHEARDEKKEKVNNSSLPSTWRLAQLFGEYNTRPMIVLGK